MPSTICLNMIVKDEAHIIEETLTCMLPYIHYWVICDTGSTDGTQNLIRNFFRKHGIEGELYEHEWKDFGRNRTMAFKKAFDKTDYVWVMDADDLIVGNLKLPEVMNKDCYELKLGGEFFTYYRALIFNNRIRWCYRGVLHEYPQCIEPNYRESHEKIDGRYYVDSRRLGSRNKDPSSKYRRDAEMLEKALETEEDIDLIRRYYFYLAQSYRDDHQYDKAILNYKKRIEHGHWVEEVYVSHYNIANMLISMNGDEKEIRHHHIQAYKTIPQRSESLYDLAKYYFEKKDYQQAYSIIKMCLTTPYPEKCMLFVNQSIYEFEAKYLYFQICRDMKKPYDLVIEQLEQVSNLPPWIRNDIMTHKHTRYPDTVIEKLPRPSDDQGFDVIMTVTTCKRLDLFRKTMNSFLTCCTDLDRIDRFYCIDDHSSEEDRTEMQRLYPFFRFLWNDATKKGHAHSMNQIYDLVRKHPVKHVFHIEDDWVFFRKDSYITKGVTILRETGDDIRQVLLNPNYAEVLYHPVFGGIPASTVSGLSYLVHEHAVPETPEYKHLMETRYKDKPNCVYWPHFSFRPSVVCASVYRELGAFDTEVGFFEFVYAKRYHYEKQYRSVFLPEIACIHVGRLTSERFDATKENAYTLNETSQFVHDIDWSDYEIIRDKDSFGNDLLQVPSKDLLALKKACDEIGIADGFNSLGFIKKSIVEDDFLIDVSGIVLYKKKKFSNFYCINLERRPDRKENMTRLFDKNGLSVHFVRAIDGLTLSFTKELYELFRDNDFGYRKGFIGVALTHRNLWAQLLEDHRFDFYVIMEDDIEITHPDFASQIERMCETPDWECIALGYHSFGKRQVYNEDPVRLIPMPREDNAGSIFGYVLHKRGADKLLKYIEENKIRHGIDYCVNKSDLRIDVTVPCMVRSPWVRDLAQDSDIQLNFECFSIQDFMEDQFDFYPRMDSKDNDLFYVPNKKLEDMMEIAKKDPRIRAFNTLGFFKTKVHLLESSPYYSSPNDGIYVKKQDRVGMLVYLLGDEIPDNPSLYEFLQKIDISELVLCGKFSDLESLRGYLRDQPFTVISEIEQHASDPSSYDRVLILPMDMFSFTGSEERYLAKIRSESKKIVQL